MNATLTVFLPGVYDWRDIRNAIHGTLGRTRGRGLAHPEFPWLFAWKAMWCQVIDGGTRIEYAYRPSETPIV